MHESSSVLFTIEYYNLLENNKAKQLLLQIKNSTLSKTNIGKYDNRILIYH